METVSYVVRVEKLKEDCYVGSVPDVPGCNTEGYVDYHSARSKVIDNLIEQIKDYKARGFQLPKRKFPLRPQTERVRSDGVVISLDEMCQVFAD